MHTEDTMTYIAGIETEDSTIAVQQGILLPGCKSLPMMKNCRASLDHGC